MRATRARVRWGVFILAGLLAGLLVLPEPALAQCALCRAAVTRSAEGQEIARELNAAILVMLFAPYLVCGAVAAALLRARMTPFVARLRRFHLRPR
jgi:hypothetical protein